MQSPEPARLYGTSEHMFVNVNDSQTKAVKAKGADILPRCSVLMSPDKEKLGTGKMTVPKVTHL